MINETFEGINGLPKAGETVAVVIAAGLSRRMGEFKPLLDIGGRPALLRLIDSIKAAKIARIVVVTGHRCDIVEETVKSFDAEIDLVFNDRYEEGMFTSVKTGVKYAAMAMATQALLFPVDVPLVRTGTIRDFFDTYDATTAGLTPKPFAVPVCRGKNGHPLLIPCEYFDEILEYEGEGGLKAVRNKYDETLMKMDTDDEGCLLDMDTPEDYEKLLKYYEASGSKSDAI